MNYSLTSTDREIKYLLVFRVSLTFRTFHVRGTIVLLVKVYVKFARIKYIILLGWLLCECYYIKVIQHSFWQEVNCQTFIHIYVVILIHRCKGTIFRRKYVPSHASFKVSDCQGSSTEKSCAPTNAAI